MKRYLDTASRLVTSNDELIESLEGLECLVLEAVFHLNAGNLRRAWLFFKPAIGLAQLVGLDSGNIVNLMVLDPNSIVYPAIMWYRIVGQDRYLALVLGLPAGTAEDSFVPSAAQVPDDCPTGRPERQHCVLMGRMASQHNQKDEDLDIICSIDKGFQEAAQSVPPEWWLLPRTRYGERSSGIDSGSNLEDMMRILVQITHYNLLLLLHLPSMLRARGKGVQDYSRDTCVNSSRELLNRYIRLRCLKRAPFCCRMIDFCAFTACLTLLLSHINRISHREPGTSDVLAHHHLSDRATVEETVELMLEFNETNSDASLRQTVAILKCLCGIEADAAKRSRELAGIQTPNCDADDPKHALRVNIPSFGTIYITRDGISTDTSTSSSRNHVLDGGSHGWSEEFNIPLSPSFYLRDDEAGMASTSTLINNSLIETRLRGPRHKSNEPTSYNTADVAPEVMEPIEWQTDLMGGVLSNQQHDISENIGITLDGGDQQASVLLGF